MKFYVALHIRELGTLRKITSLSLCIVFIIMKNVIKEIQDYGCEYLKTWYDKIVFKKYGEISTSTYGISFVDVHYTKLI